VVRPSRPARHVLREPERPIDNSFATVAIFSVQVPFPDVGAADHRRESVPAIVV
jgi:hypothetical protein